MTQDENYLNLLSIFHYVVGGITALFSSFFLLHVFMGIALLLGGFEGGNPPPPFMGWLFILFPGIFVLMGWALAGFIIAAGRKLRRRKSHMFCMVVAGLECILMPFGTVLGVFTIILLMKEPVKALFEAPSNKPSM